MHVYAVRVRLNTLSPKKTSIALSPAVRLCIMRYPATPPTRHPPAAADHPATAIRCNPHIPPLIPSNTNVRIPPHPLVNLYTESPKDCIGESVQVFQIDSPRGVYVSLNTCTNECSCLNFVPRETEEVLNLGQHVTDLIRLANEIQKVAADGKETQRIYHLALEAKDSATYIQTWALGQMAKTEGAYDEKPRSGESWSEAE